MIDIIKDTAVLTTIPEKSLKKLIDKNIYCISEAVVEARLSDQKLLELDIGLGILYIQMDDESIRYKFVPGQKLEETVKNSFINKQNLLEDALDAALVNRLTSIYKDLIE